MRHFTFRRRLMAFVVCVFACISANAWKVTVNGSTVTIDGEEDGLPQNWTDLIKGSNNGTENLEDVIHSAQTLIFKGNMGQYGLTAIDQGKGSEENPLYAATTVDFSGATFVETFKETITYTDYQGNQQTVDKYQNAMRFGYFKNLTTAILANVKTLNQDTFQNCMHITTFVIPSSVTCIERDMITNTPIVSIRIPATVQYIETQAFMNAAIKELIDVYVEGHPVAEKNAFDFQVTVGQTDADYEKYATLHFPEGEEEFFTNTQHPLTQAVSLSKKAFQEWLDAHKNYEGANGWQQFINSASGTPDTPPAGKTVILRTFSDSVARLVPLNFRAYLVTGVTTEDVGEKKNYTVKLQQIFAIPAYTGVILYGEIDERSAGYSLGRIPTWDPGEEGYVAPYTRNSGSVSGVDQEGTVSIKKYMVPTVESTKLYPYYKDMTSSDWSDENWALKNVDTKSHYSSGSVVTDRNFTLHHLKGTTLADKQTEDYIGFFRVSPNTNSGNNKAYLSLPATVFTSASGAEALVVKPTSPASHIFRTDEWNNSWTETGNWGQRESGLGVLEVKFAGDFEDTIVNAISNIINQSINDKEYYTLQGIRVSQPQKGVYIKDGKKVVFK